MPSLRSCTVIEGQKDLAVAIGKMAASLLFGKNDKFLATMKKKPTKTMVKALLKNGIAPVKGLTSKKRKQI